jgi:hypothetical protein
MPMDTTNAVVTAIVGNPFNSGVPMASRRAANPEEAAPPFEARTTPGTATASSRGGWMTGPNRARRLTQHTLTRHPVK